MHRIRPHTFDAEDDSSSLGCLEDEEFVVTDLDLEDALRTRIGGRAPKRDNEEEEGTCKKVGGGHYHNSEAAIERCQGVWGKRSQPLAARRREFREPDQLKDILKAARASRTGSVTGESTGKKLKRRRGRSEESTDVDSGDGKVEVIRPASVDEVRSWFKALRVREREEGGLLLNDDQLAAMSSIVDQICAELQEKSETVREPLFKVLHGGPGAGKSEVVKYILELFRDVLRWKVGIEYHVGAFQAVMAEQLGGDTLHHIAGIQARQKKNGKKGNSDKKEGNKDLMRRMARARWLIIDEISMVSPRLLAEVDMRLRDATRRVGTKKSRTRGADRPFGGLNILCVGDFWQLPPTDGGFLGAVPAEFLQNSRKDVAAPDIAHGQALFWSRGEGCVQGVSELPGNERCKDKWMQEVQEEIRKGCLSEDNWRFLHGKKTGVPGSWCRGQALCGTEKCATLGEQREETTKSTRKRIAAEECAQCRRERRTRERVAKSETDVRFADAMFVGAPSIVPNNDIKYEINKLRSRKFADEKGETITWVPARDVPGQEVLRTISNVRARKLSWLGKHDKECGDLYGMLPLVKGLPVFLTEHLDRSDGKKLLRGKQGFIDSWVLDDEEKSTFTGQERILTHLPKVVFIRFPDAKWKLPHMEEDGVYPVCMSKKTWYLDKGRRNPVLSVKRMQVPLAPGFAMTAHAAQGQTLEAAIVDLQLAAGSNYLGSYVAITRVRSREGLLILRPFAREIFTQGSPEGPGLLLRCLRGEVIDWEDLERRFLPKKSCDACGMGKLKSEFTGPQWNNLLRVHCRSCVQTLRDRSGA